LNARVGVAAAKTPLKQRSDAGANMLHMFLPEDRARELETKCASAGRIGSSRPSDRA
jgi:hypothetical protein